MPPGILQDYSIRSAGIAVTFTNSTVLVVRILMYFVIGCFLFVVVFCSKTYMCITLGFTSIAWVVGALALWMVKLMELVYQINDKPSENVSFIFGAVTCAAGFCGVTVGTMGAQFYRRFNSKADTLVCALGNLLAAPFLFFGLILANNYVTVTWVCVFLGEMCLFLNWALVPDILMYVLIPVRRSTGNGMQMLSSHLLGDALSPLIIGAVSIQSFIDPRPCLN